jgi:hypothetical protein
MIKNTKTKDVEVAKKLINIYQSSQDRKIDFDLSFEYVKRLLDHKTCYYTGIEFTEEGGHARSFDRIDSNQGYVEGNVVACTIDINGKKANLTFEEIEALYKKILTHHNKQEQKRIEAEAELNKIQEVPDVIEKTKAKTPATTKRRRSVKKTEEKV